MSASVLQEQVGPQPTSGTATTVLSTALASNATVGSTIEAWVLWQSSTAPTSVQDSASQSYTLQKSVFSSGLGATLALYTFANNQSATKLVVTATWSAAQSFRACWVKEIGGVATSSPIQGTPVINVQANPGTGANAITSGNVTPSPNALLSSLCLGSAPGANTTFGTTNSPINGTNSNATWGGGYRGASESYYLTTNSAIAATYGNSGGASATFFTGAVLYSELAAAIVPYPPLSKGGMNVQVCQ